ncbi:MAG: hypothetical protein V1661_00855 [bacterium]
MENVYAVVLVFLTLSTVVILRDLGRIRNIMESWAKLALAQAQVEQEAKKEKEAKKKNK